MACVWLFNAVLGSREPAAEKCIVLLFCASPSFPLRHEIVEIGFLYREIREIDFYMYGNFHNMKLGDPRVFSHFFLTYVGHFTPGHFAGAGFHLKSEKKVKFPGGGAGLPYI